MIQSFLQAQKADTLLIVDDNEINREVLDHIFSTFYPTEHAENGKDGLDKILACPESCTNALWHLPAPSKHAIAVSQFESMAETAVTAPEGAKECLSDI